MGKISYGAANEFAFGLTQLMSEVNSSGLSADVRTNPAPSPKTGGPSPTVNFEN